MKWSKRGPHGEYMRQFFDKLTSPEYREDMEKGLQSENIRTRRICVNALFDASQPDYSLALRHLLREPDPFLRKVVFERLYLQGQNAVEIAHVFMNDKYPANRALALRVLCESHENGALDIARTMLLDKSALVRELARGIVRQQDPDYVLFVLFYQEHLEDRTAAAIYGIGETGTQKEADAIEQYVNDNRISVVRAAMSSLMRLNKSKYSDRITEMLNDASVGVVKTAQSLLLKYRNIDFDRVHEIFLNTPFDHTKRKCAAILFTAPKWSSLEYMLLACGVESARELALQAIQKWLFSFNRSFMQPTEKQKECLRISVNKQEVLPAEIAKHLLLVLK